MDNEREISIMRVHYSLKKIIRDYIKRYFEKEKVLLSDSQATKKIAEKIISAGGIKV